MNKKKKISCGKNHIISSVKCDRIGYALSIYLDDQQFFENGNGNVCISHTVDT